MSATPLPPDEAAGLIAGELLADVDDDLIVGLLDGLEQEEVAELLDEVAAAWQDKLPVIPSESWRRGRPTREEQLAKGNDLQVRLAGAMELLRRGLAPPLRPLILSYVVWPSAKMDEAFAHAREQAE